MSTRDNIRNLPENVDRLKEATANLARAARGDDIVVTPAPISAPKSTGPVIHHHGPMTHGALDVKREVNYVRQQKGHSVFVHILLGVLTAGLSLPWTIYYAVSPNHFFHA